MEKRRLSPFFGQTGCPRRFFGRRFVSTIGYFRITKLLLSSSAKPRCTLSLLEEKACTEREVGGGDEPALSARTCRSSASKTSSRAALASPLHPPVAVSPGRIKLSHPALCPNTRLSVVMPCFSHHSGLVIGERLKQKSFVSKKPFPVPV